MREKAGGERDEARKESSNERQEKRALSWSVVLFVPAVIFVGLVMPIWLVLHYRQKSKDQSGLSSSDRADLEEMAKAADRMATRIGALEAILDSEISDWRTRHQGTASGNSASRGGGE